MKQVADSDSRDKHCKRRRASEGSVCDLFGDNSKESADDDGDDYSGTAGFVYNAEETETKENIPPINTGASGEKSDLTKASDGATVTPPESEEEKLPPKENIECPRSWRPRWAPPAHPAVPPVR